MKDTVKLTESGGTLGFTIQPAILTKLNLKVKDPVTIEIFDETGEQSLTEFTRPLKKMGKGSYGVTIRYYIVNDLGLTRESILRVDIRNPSI